MEIVSLRLAQLNNHEYGNFHRSNNNLLLKHDPESMGVKHGQTAYAKSLEDFGVAMQKIEKSIYTEELVKADELRDAVFRGMSEAVSSACNHYDPVVKSNADRLKLVFDHYGNVARLPLAEETESLNLLIADLNGAHASEVQAIALRGWVDELQAKNNHFSGLMSQRTEESALATTLKVREVRQNLDETYKAMVKRINALILVNGPEMFTEYVNELNVLITNTKALVAQRYGILAAAKGKAPAQPEG
jgi:hypothetical protein